MSKMKQQAYDDMTITWFIPGNDVISHFTFETYVNSHSKAHMILAEHQETLAESKKVDDFLRGIQDPSTVMLAGKANVYGIAPRCATAFAKPQITSTTLFSRPQRPYSSPYWIYGFIPWQGTRLRTIQRQGCQQRRTRRRTPRYSRWDRMSQPDRSHQRATRSYHQITR